MIEIKNPAGVAYRWSFDHTDYELFHYAGSATLLFSFRTGADWSSPSALEAEEYRVLSQTEAEAKQLAESFARRW